MHNPDPKPIRTTYNGVFFRSRTEARWAVFFDALGVRWQYEHEGYELPSGRYLPDFWLPDVGAQSNEIGCFVELKPHGTPSDVEQRRVIELCNLTGRGVVLFCGAPALLPEQTGFGENLRGFSGVQGNGTAYIRSKFPGRRSATGDVLSWEWDAVGIGQHNFTIINGEPHVRFLNGDCDTDHPSGEWNRNHRHPRILSAIQKATTTSFWEPKQ